VAFAWIYGELSVWMPSGIRYVVIVVWSSVLMAFLILEQIVLLSHLFEKSIRNLPVGTHWSLLDPVREKTPQAIDIPVCYPTLNAYPRTKWSADKPNHAHRLLHLIVQLEYVCPLSSFFGGPKCENHTSNNSHRRQIVLSDVWALYVFLFRGLQIYWYKCKTG
jgi:hypothetical protein